MQALTITPPKGWQNPKTAQMLVEHVAHHGGTLELHIESGMVKSGTLTMPNDPPDNYKTERVEGIRAQIARLKQLVGEYAWTVETPEEKEQEGGLQTT